MPHYEYDKDYPFAAFITNLGKYNEGSLVGEWVKFPTTAEEMQKLFERIGIGSKDDFGQPYEEWFITDHDDLGRYYIEELDAIQVPEHLKNYIDYEAYGRDIALEEGGQFTDLGYVRDTGYISIHNHSEIIFNIAFSDILSVKPASHP